MGIQPTVAVNVIAVPEQTAPEALEVIVTWGADIVVVIVFEEIAAALNPNLAA